MAVLMDIVDFETMLIGAEGARRLRKASDWSGNQHPSLAQPFY
ncbi:MULTISPECIES: hypothetical protein [unclassified Bacillus (in: firmicutes)]|nr:MULTISPECIES: hypothetical protein [unclassified Bacillus (in: firmicutes)]